MSTPAITDGPVDERSITDVEADGPFALDAREPMSAFGAELFDFANRLNRTHAALLTGALTTDDTAAVRRLVHFIEEEPFRFAERFLTLEREVAGLLTHHDQIAQVLQGYIDLPQRLERAEATLSRLRAMEVV